MKLDQLKLKTFIGAIVLFLAFPSFSFVKDVQLVEGKIQAEWSRSELQTMDLLLVLGIEGLKLQNYETMLLLFATLTDHSPEFAQGRL